jgi:hypothetical protein
MGSNDEESKCGLLCLSLNYVAKRFRIYEIFDINNVNFAAFMTV